MCTYIFYGDRKPSSRSEGILIWEQYRTERGVWWHFWFRGEKHYVRNPICRLSGLVRRLLGHPGAVPGHSPGIVVGQEVVFAPEFAVVGASLRTLAREEAAPPGLTSLEGQPGLYRLCGRVLRSPVLPDEGWLIDAGDFSGFTVMYAENQPLLRGSLVTAEVQLRMHGNLTGSHLCRALLRYEDLIPYWRWQVVGSGWASPEPNEAEQKSLARAMFLGHQTTPSARLVCRPIGPVRPPSRHWSAFMAERAGH